MTMRFTISLPDALGEYMREQVASGAYESVSAYLTRAAETLRDVDPLELLIAGMVAETGEPDADAEAWAQRAVKRQEAW